MNLVTSTLRVDIKCETRKGKKGSAPYPGRPPDSI